MKKEGRIKLWKHNIGCVAASNENHGGGTGPKSWLVLLDTGTEPTISRCALSRTYPYFFFKKKYGTTLWPSWPRCKLSKSCCVLVGAWKRSRLTRLFTSHGHERWGLQRSTLAKGFEGFYMFWPSLSPHAPSHPWLKGLHAQSNISGTKKAFMCNWCLKLRCLRFIFVI